MRYPQLNEDLLKKTVQHIETQRAGWKQSVWREFNVDDDGIVDTMPNPCYTAMCFAGETAFLAGEQYLVTGEHVAKIRALEDKELAAELTYLVHEISHLVLDSEAVITAKEFTDFSEHAAAFYSVTGIDPQTRVTAVAYRSRELLGLTEGESGLLYSGVNTFDDIKALVEALLSGKRGWDELYEARDAARAALQAKS